MLHRNNSNLDILAIKLHNYIIIYNLNMEEIPFLKDMLYSLMEKGLYTPRQKQKKKKRLQCYASAYMVGGSDVRLLQRIAWSQNLLTRLWSMTKEAWSFGSELKFAGASIETMSVSWS